MTNHTINQSSSEATGHWSLGIGHFPIHHTFGPHVTFGAYVRSFGLLVQPWLWMEGDSREKLRAELTKAYGTDAHLFASGRESLLALLQALSIGKGDEVIVQGYTCVVVPNAIHAAGAKTVYADIEEESLNLDPEDVAKRITPRTKAVICQHTFGIPAPLSELQALCKKHGIPLIEDCAHVLPDEKGPVGLARTGEYVLLSFGRDKAISGVSGGGLLSRHPATSAALKKLETAAKPLLYPRIYYRGRFLYALGLGRAYLALTAKLGLLRPIVTGQEKRGVQEKTLYRLPNVCAEMALQSFKALPGINAHRRKITSLYLAEARKKGWPVVAGACEGLPLQKLPLFAPNANAIRATLKKSNVHLADGWTGCVVCPEATDASAAGYQPGTDPNAEAACMGILSLPTHPTMTEKQAQRLIDLLNPLLSGKNDQ
jgi:perosamine synthetase